MQSAPVTFQLTAVLDVPVTLALKGWVPAVTTEALAGLRLNSTATAVTIVTLAEADLLGSAALVALTVTDAGREQSLEQRIIRWPKSYHTPHQCSQNRLPSTLSHHWKYH